MASTVIFFWIYQCTIASEISKIIWIHCYEFPIVIGTNGFMVHTLLPILLRINQMACCTWALCMVTVGWGATAMLNLLFSVRLFRNLSSFCDIAFSCLDVIVPLVCSSLARHAFMIWRVLPVRQRHRCMVRCSMGPWYCNTFIKCCTVVLCRPPLEFEPPQNACRCLDWSGKQRSKA